MLTRGTGTAAKVVATEVAKLYGSFTIEQNPNIGVIITGGTEIPNLSCKA